MAGPIELPTWTDVPSRPRAKPAWLAGVAAEISAAAAACEPVTAPCARRSPSSCQALVTKPITAISTAPPSIDRTSMILRP